MKKHIVAVSLATVVALATFTACGGTSEKTTAALAYDDGIHEDGSYNTNIYFRNDLQVNHAADPDCIWVSTEENAEWGGWFYLYTTNLYYNIMVMRSKDMNIWEPVGHALDFDGSEWITTDIWAPEVTYCPDDGLYYMYASAEATDEKRGGVASDNLLNELFVAVSDNPGGGFKLATEDAYGTYYGTAECNLSFNRDHINKNPALAAEDYIYDDIKTDARGRKFRGLWCIDPSPFRDDDGQWYLYFRCNLSLNREYNSGCLLAVVKMIDMVTPDYASLSFVAYAAYRSVEDAAHNNLFPLEKETTVNEAPQMIKHNGIYYLTFAFGGYTSRAMYCMAAAVSSDPMGGFVKLRQEHGNPSLYIEAYMDHMSGPGHHSFVEVGDELFLIYHSLLDRETGNSNPRGIAIDRVEFLSGHTFGVNASEYGITTETGTFDIIYTNGPTWSLQPLGSAVSGYRNVAREATVSASNAKASTIGYLNDGIFANHTLTSAFEYESNGATSITLSWETPVTVCAVMVYNSFSFTYAFSQIDYIEFALAEQPLSWHGETLDTVYIKDLAFNPMYWNQKELFMRPGGSCHAVFDEITVTEITITISQKLDDFKERGDNIRIGDIVVLGRG